MRGIDTGRMPVEGGSWDTATGEDPDEEVIEDTDDTEDTGTPVEGADPTAAGDSSQVLAVDRPRCTWKRRVKEMLRLTSTEMNRRARTKKWEKYRKEKKRKLRKKER